MRIITDADLLSWEVYPSGGKFGFPDEPKIVFHCLTDPSRRSRFSQHAGDSVTAERAVQDLPDEALRALLASSEALD